MAEQDDDLAALEKLLAAESSDEDNAPQDGPQTSAVHRGDTDSSDDERERECFDSQYNSCGLQIKNIIKNDDKNVTKIERAAPEKPAPSFKKRAPLENGARAEKNNKSNDVYSDPVFGMRISNPVISGDALQERMRGRKAVTFAHLNTHLAVGGDSTEDWVLAGVVVRKSNSRESQKGSKYSIWTLSDLKGDLKTVALFLFSKSHEQLWKTPEGTVVAVLNPSILEKNKSNNEVTLSVDNPDRVMIMGASKDFGRCASRKKNGDPCTSFVNVNQCRYCIYHVKQEYSKCSSKRSDLQASFSGRGAQNLKDKVFGRDTFIYGGKQFGAAVRNPKLVERDNKRLNTLSEHFKKTPEANEINPAKKRKASHVEVNHAQRVKDLKRLEMLGGRRIDDLENTNIDDNAKLPLRASPPSFRGSSSGSTPKLSGLSLKRDSVVDLCLSYSDKQKERAKLTALKWIKENGPIGKSNPNNLRGKAKKKPIEEDGADKNDSKRSRTEATSDRFRAMMEMSSSHSDLIATHDDAEKEKYFKKLEMKESMKEKMLNTFKVPCKGVKCLKCAYTSFSAADKCKQERHPLKVFDTFKRFFKCGNCGNRTALLEIFPLHSCNNCQCSKWQRAAMINERKAVTIAETLSIRGDEEKHINGVVRNGSNINLLVPDDT